MAEITPFRIAISDAAIDDLKVRLEGARWPQPITEDWSHGQPVTFIRALADYWRRDFDWRKAEAQLNRLPQFLTAIDGQTIHFVHVRSGVANAIPLLLVHGWPSSFAEFTDLVPLLTTDKDGQAFDLVIPSIPGYGLSTPLSGPGWDSARIAGAFDTLMRALGYARYGAHGGDAGALIVRELGILHPEGLIGVHLQHIFAFPSGASGEMEQLTPFEREGFANLDSFQRYAGYQAIQQKRPGTLAYGLVDSPVGLLAWNSELFVGFEGQGARFLDRDRYLTHVALFWFTGSAGSAANHYFEDAQTGAGYREVMNPTPAGVAVFPWDYRSVRVFAARANAIVHWTEMPRGGHFAAVDAPDLLAADLRTFFAGLA